MKRGQKNFSGDMRKRGGRKEGLQRDMRKLVGDGYIYLLNCGCSFICFSYVITYKLYNCDTCGLLYYSYISVKVYVLITKNRI